MELRENEYLKYATECFDLISMRLICLSLIRWMSVAILLTY